MHWNYQFPISNNASLEQTSLKKIRGKSMNTRKLYCTRKAGQYIIKRESPISLFLSLCVCVLYAVRMCVPVYVHCTEHMDSASIVSVLSNRLLLELLLNILKQ